VTLLKQRVLRFLDAIAWSKFQSVVITVPPSCFDRLL
jgi:hypothetical protein